MPPRQRSLFLLALVPPLAVLYLGACQERDLPTRPQPPSPDKTLQQAATFVGSSSCASCHQQEYADWKSSHHHHAMEPANKDTVLGDFSNTTFTHFGQTWRFFTEDDRFYVEAPDGEGNQAVFPIPYTFGITPLQQYLIPFPGGRLQALQVCWDSRPAEEGGQRWYHLYPDEEVPPGDLLHWTGRHFNWNFMCADCHSTGLAKQYDDSSLTYDTRWAEMTVGCEACHGPASGHLAWAENLTITPPEGLSEAEMGLVVSLREPHSAGWAINPETDKPHRVPALTSHVQIDSCAPCHSHRRPITPFYGHAHESFLDSFLPSTLSDSLYHHDGQIDEEVYVYGSFIQSKMFKAGVRCTDCHHPHTMQIKVQDNRLCTQCHQPELFDTPAHHFHPPGGPGASCVDCHMPGKYYMGVDFRRDHSMRIPRPDLALKIASPDACTSCHDDKDQAWAAAISLAWWGDLAAKHGPHYGELFHAARQGGAAAIPKLADLATGAGWPAHVRATAAEELRAYASQPTAQAALVAALADPDPHVRARAASSFLGTDPQRALVHVRPLLEDPVRAVRIEAARALARSFPRMDAPARQAFDAASAEFHEASRAINDTAGGHVGLALFYADLQKPAEAEAAYLTALRIEPDHAPAAVNLAELLHQLGRTAEGLPILDAAREAARALDADRGTFPYAIGQLHVRLKDYTRATSYLAEAAALLPDDAHIHFFYGVALNQIGQPEAALKPLERARALAPDNIEYLHGSATIALAAGQVDLARSLASDLARRQPQDQGFLQLLRHIESLPPSPPKN